MFALFHLIVSREGSLFLAILCVLFGTSKGEYQESVLEGTPPLSADYVNDESVSSIDDNDEDVLALEDIHSEDDHLLDDTFDDLRTLDEESVIKRLQRRAIEDGRLAVDADGDLNLKPPASSYVKSDSTEQSSNVTINVNEASSNASYRCICTTGKETAARPVELVNSTRLLGILVNEPNVLSRQSPAECVVILFYARYCPFSSMAAPHFNALSRVFQDIKFAAVDAMKFHSFNTQYGIVGVPTVMLFHNGRPAAKFNESEYTLEQFTKFITKNTGIEREGKLYVKSSDFSGPVPSTPSKEFDYCLALSWAFIAICAVYFFSQSSWWKWIVETVLNTWRESEAQHEHVE